MLIKEILSAVLMIFIMLVPGFIFKKKNVITDRQSDAVSSIVVNLTWPCLVIDAMQMPFSMQTLKDSGYLFILAMIIFAVVLVVSFVVRKLVKMNKTQNGIMAFMLLFGNTGFMGLPVINALYGNDALFYAAILELVNDILMFTVGMALIYTAAGRKFEMNFRQFLSPGLIGVIIGLLLFLFDIQLPGIIGGAVSKIGSATTPLTMFLIGFQVAGIKFRNLVSDSKIYIVSILKLIAVPVIALAVAKVAAGDLSLIEKVLVASFAMPVASCAAIFAQQYNAEQEMATKGVLLSTVASLITIPLFAIVMEMI